MDPADYYVYVATPDGGLNLRHGPGTNYDKAMDGRIPDGVRLYISYTSGNWGFTSYNGYQGWVALKQTSATPPDINVPIEQPIEDIKKEIKEEVKEEVKDEIKEETKEETKETLAQQKPDANSQDDAKTAKNAMANQILLIAAILILVIIIAVLILIIVNMRSKR